jgi:AmmeMemoRadiSam system protein B
VFVLGPSHYTSLKGCALPMCRQIETPLGDLRVDVQFIQDLLRDTHLFCRLNSLEDEKEHSMEMQYPYLKKVLPSETLIVPVMVGHLPSSSDISSYASIFAQHMTDPSTLFIISSDFCHWGTRFQYIPSDPKTPIHEYIENIDKEGLNLIQAQNYVGFTNYLNRTQNTICGRHPILILLYIMEEVQKKHSSSKVFTTRLLHYKQSSRIKKMTESSVSYAALIIAHESAL